MYTCECSGGGGREGGRDGEEEEEAVRTAAPVGWATLLVPSVPGLLALVRLLVLIRLD